MVNSARMLGWHYIQWLSTICCMLSDRAGRALRDEETCWIFPPPHPDILMESNIQTMLSQGVEGGPWDASHISYLSLTYSAALDLEQHWVSISWVLLDSDQEQHKYCWIIPLSLSYDGRAYPRLQTSLSSFQELCHLLLLVWASRLLACMFQKLHFDNCFRWWRGSCPLEEWRLEGRVWCFSKKRCLVRVVLVRLTWCPRLAPKHPPDPPFSPGTNLFAVEIQTIAKQGIQSTCSCSRCDDMYGWPCMMHKDDDDYFNHNVFVIMENVKTSVD